jgi:hypothetical protein
MCKGAACPVCRREQAFQAAPEHVDQCGRWHRFPWLVCRWRLPLPLAIVIIAGPRLVPPAPPRPLQEARRAPLYHNHKLPKQPADFGPAQADWSPRWALKRARLALGNPCAPFLRATSVPVSARTTAKNACAHMANVVWRYHPVQRRTS